MGRLLRPTVIGLFRRIASPASRVVRREQFIERGKVAFEIVDEDGTAKHIVAQRLADFTLATTAHRARLVADDALGTGTDQSPRRCRGVLFHTRACNRWGPCRPCSARGEC